MAANDFPRPEIGAVRLALAQWFRLKNRPDIRFLESSEPKHDASDDYVVVYEAIFEPVDVERARVELWLTDDGFVAIGLETRDRIAERLGVRNLQHGFATGHEPRHVSLLALCALLDSIAAGEISVRAKTFVGVLGKARASTTTAVLEKLLRGGYTVAEWISPDDHRSPSQLLRYRAW